MTTTRRIGPPSEPGLDRPGSAAQIDLDAMTPEEQAIVDERRTELSVLLASEWHCPGDGNKDVRVDEADLAGLLESWGGPGFWDIDARGVTGGADLGLLLGDWNRSCEGAVDPEGQGIPACLEPAG